MTSSEVYASFVAHLLAYIANNKKQATTVVIEIGKMDIVVVKIEKWLLRP